MKKQTIFQYQAALTLALSRFSPDSVQVKSNHLLVISLPLFIITFWQIQNKKSKVDWHLHFPHVYF